MEIIGRGTKSTVYDNGDTVIMQGNFSRDMFKLAVHANLGKLHSLKIDGKFYNAVIEKMYDSRYQSEDEQSAIYDLMCFVDMMNVRFDCGVQFLQKLAQTTTGYTQQTVNFVLSLNIDVNNCDFWVDNHEGNYLIDESGYIVPFDVFDFNSSDLSSAARDFIRQMLTKYVE